METVTHEGKAYQIGALYLFKDTDSQDEEIGMLSDVDVEGGGTLLFRSRCGNKSEWFHQCFEINCEVGTIKSAPIELEADCWYMCHDEQTGKTLPAKCGSAGKYWMFSEESETAGECGWLRPLYKMVKA